MSGGVSRHILWRVTTHYVEDHDTLCGLNEPVIELGGWTAFDGQGNSTIISFIKFAVHLQPVVQDQ